MIVFEIKDWELHIDPIAWGYKPFEAILKRDKTKGKQIALKEMQFIYNFADIKSDFMYLTDEEERAKEIRDDVGLPEKWKMDATMQVAVDFYKERSVTITGELYAAALCSASDVSDYLKETKALLKERDDKGKPVNSLSSITTALKQVPIIMKDLKSAYTELIKEKEIAGSKSSGSKQHGFFEDGL